MGDTNLLLYLFGGGAITTLLGAFLKSGWDWIQGKHEREREAAHDRRDAITRYKDEVRTAEKVARDASEAARRWREHASDIRIVVMRDHGITTSQLPPWPDDPVIKPPPET